MYWRYKGEEDEKWRVKNEEWKVKSEKFATAQNRAKAIVFLRALSARLGAKASKNFERSDNFFLRALAARLGSKESKNFFNSKLSCAPFGCSGAGGRC